MRGAGRLQLRARFLCRQAAERESADLVAGWPVARTAAAHFDRSNRAVLAETALFPRVLLYLFVYLMYEYLEVVIYLLSISKFVI